jgi:hypothetical protein
MTKIHYGICIRTAQNDWETEFKGKRFKLSATEGKIHFGKDENNPIYFRILATGVAELLGLVHNFPVETRLGYLIVCVNDSPQFEQKYLTSDPSSGYLWTDKVDRAEIFPVLEDAYLALEDPAFQRAPITSDGKKYPPYLIDTGVNIPKGKVEGHCVIRIIPLTLGKPLHEQKHRVSLP